MPRLTLSRLRSAQALALVAAVADRRERRRRRYLRHAHTKTHDTMMMHTLAGNVNVYVNENVYVGCARMYLSRVDRKRSDTPVDKGSDRKQQRRRKWMPLSMRCRRMSVAFPTRAMYSTNSCHRSFGMRVRKCHGKASSTSSWHCSWCQIIHI